MRCSVNWHGVQPVNIDEEWGVLGPQVTRALARRHPTHDAEQIRAACTSGAMQMWVVDGYGFCVTEVRRHPLRTDCVIVLLGGCALEQWIHLLPSVLEPWAREKGCQCIRAFCRLGLERVLHPLGWMKEQVVMAKELSNG
jgi:hypothetical protein